MNADILVADEAGELIDYGTGGDTLPAPMPRHAHMVDELAGDTEWAHPPGDQRFCLNRPTWRAHPHPVQIGDRPIGGELWTELDEQLGL
jgi:hypothetical protein